MRGRRRIWGLVAGLAMGLAVWGSGAAGAGGGEAFAEPGVVGIEKAAAAEPGKIAAIESNGIGTGEWDETESAAAKASETAAEASKSTAAGSSKSPAPTETTPESTGTKAEESPSLNLHALSAILIDGDSGRVLYEKDAHTFRPMASTTKIMTCILALENGNPADICTVSETAASQPKVRLGARAGSRFALGDLLYSLMLESHNDTAVVIAEYIGGSVEGFAALMNQKARDIGCTDTCFITPNGLDAAVTGPDGQERTERTHGTTAADLAALMQYCVMKSPQKDAFRQITRTSNYTFTDKEGKQSYSCVNHNALLSLMKGAFSGKTGFTGGAGYCYVGALEDEGRTYILALLGCGWPPHKTYKWADARTLFQYGMERFHYRDVYVDQPLPELPVAEGVPADDPFGTDARLSLTLGTSKEREEGEESEEGEEREEGEEKEERGEREEGRPLRLLLAEEETVERQLELPESLIAPVEKGTIVGCVRYTLHGRTVRADPVYAARDIPGRSLSYCAGQVFRRFLLLRS